MYDFVGFNLVIIPAHACTFIYKAIIAHSALCTSLGIYRLISNVRARME